MRLHNYVAINNLNELFQSAYKSCHSTETAQVYLLTHHSLKTTITNSEVTFPVGCQ